MYISALLTLCQKMASDPTIDGYEPPFGCWELNSGTSGKAASALNYSTDSAKGLLCETDN